MWHYGTWFSGGILVVGGWLNWLIFSNLSDSDFYDGTPWIWRSPNSLIPGFNPTLPYQIFCQSPFWSFSHPSQSGSVVFTPHSEQSQSADSNHYKTSIPFALCSHRKPSRCECQQNENLIPIYNAPVRARYGV